MHTQGDAWRESGSSSGNKKQTQVVTQVKVYEVVVYDPDTLDNMELQSRGVYPSRELADKQAKQLRKDIVTEERNELVETKHSNGFGSIYVFPLPRKNAGVVSTEYNGYKKWPVYTRASFLVAYNAKRIDASSLAVMKSQFTTVKGVFQAVNADQPDMDLAEWTKYKSFYKKVVVREVVMHDSVVGLSQWNRNMKSLGHGLK